MNRSTQLSALATFAPTASLRRSPLSAFEGDVAGSRYGSAVAGEVDCDVGTGLADPNGLSNAGFARAHSSAPWFASDCTATVPTVGAPSVTARTGFTHTASGVGRRASSAWGANSNFRCVQTPTQRTTSSTSGRSAGACDGAIRIGGLADLSAHPGALGLPLAAGQTVQTQGWFRDQPSPKTTHHSNALEFSMCP